MRILVAYASKMGGTKSLAKWLGQDLKAKGFNVHVLKTSEVRDVRVYDAVIVGSSIYVGKWHKNAKNFVKDHEAALRRVPVWFFSSGPLDDSAVEEDIPPVKSVAKRMERIGVRGHVTLGGRLDPDYKGPVGSALAKEHAGDWRDPEHVARWADEIALELSK